jgi:hypothetical protein
LSDSIYLVDLVVMDQGQWDLAQLLLLWLASVVKLGQAADLRKDSGWACLVVSLALEVAVLALHDRIEVSKADTGCKAWLCAI